MGNLTPLLQLQVLYSAGTKRHGYWRTEKNVVRSGRSLF